MKDNLNIEKLFQEKLGGLEADVSPKLWENISQSIGSNVGAGVAAKTGMSLMLKKVLIGTGIVAAGVTGVYLMTQGENNPKEETTLVAQNENVENNLIEDDVTIDGFAEEVDLNYGHSQEVIEELNVESDKDNQNNENNENPDNSNNSETNTETGSVDNDGGSQENTNTNSNDENQTNNGSDSNQNTTENNNTEDSNSNNEENTTVATPTGSMEINSSSFNVPSEVSFKANAKNNSSIVWNFGDGESAQGQEATHVYSQPGTYTVILTVLGERELNYTESQKVEITTKSGIDNIPNVFTPDGDRINDLFSVRTTEINTFYMVIYDLKGNKIYETQDADFVWDGSDLGGNPAGKGIYTYMIKATGNDGAMFSIPGEVQIR